MLWFSSFLDDCLSTCPMYFLQRYGLIGVFSCIPSFCSFGSLCWYCCTSGGVIYTEDVPEV
jgi:hypothetical protein